MNKKIIPNINIDGPLITRLMAASFVGFDSFLDKESLNYLRLFVRLVDQSIYEYNCFKEMIEYEIEKNDPLSYVFSKIDHIENCLHAISRAIRALDIILNGLKGQRKNINIIKFVKQETKDKIKRYNGNGIRNRIEHIDEDIYLNIFVGNIFLSIDDKYENISISNKSISLLELCEIIESYHRFVLEIISNFPKKRVGDEFYDKNGNTYSIPNN